MNVWMIMYVPFCSINWFSLLRYHIDTNQLNFPKKEMEVSNYMKDGMITDWDMFEQVLFNRV